MDNPNKSPNILQLEQFVQPGYLITLSSGNQYLLKKVLGFGNFGITFYATPLTNRGDVAIKIQSEDRAQQEAAIFEKIRNEYRNNLVRFIEYAEIDKIKNAMGQYYSNPSIQYQKIEINNQSPEVISALIMLQSKKEEAWQKLMEVGAIVTKTKKLACLVMEFVNGNPLHKKFQSKIDSLAASKIIFEISTAIDCLHSHRLIHGDLKPENVLIDNLGHVKVIDFSTAKVEGAANPTVATSCYAPFRQRTSGEVNRYSDIFSVGAIFYRLVTGKEPVIDYFYGLRNGFTSEAIMTAHVRKHFENFLEIPEEYRNVLAQIFINEINSFQYIVTSDWELQTLMTTQKEKMTLGGVIIPQGQSASLIVDYVPQKVLTFIRRYSHTPYRTISDLMQGLRQIELKAVLRNMWGKLELASQISSILIIIFALITAFRYKDNIFPINQETVEASVTSDPVNLNSDSIAILQEEASYHFDKAVDEHNAALNSESTDTKNQLYQIAFEEYEEAAERYQLILDRRSELDQATVGETYTSLGIVKVNEAIIYIDQDDSDKSILLCLEALEYLELGYSLAPSTFSLDQLVKSKYILGVLYIGGGDYDSGLYYYEQIVLHMTDPNFDQSEIENYKSYLLESLDEIDMTNISQEELTSKIEDLKSRLRNIQDTPTPSTYRFPVCVISSDIIV